MFVKYQLYYQPVQTLPSVLNTQRSGFISFSQNQSWKTKRCTIFSYSCCPTRGSSVSARTVPSRTRSREIPRLKLMLNCFFFNLRCGLHLSSFNHAVDGDEAIYAPWAVSLGRTVEGEWKHLCTGSIIAENVVITAAHCTTHTDFDRLGWNFLMFSKFLFLYSRDLFRVRAGVIDLRFAGSSDFQISSTREHPDYTVDQTNYYDVALIYLVDCLTFSSSRIQPICLPSKTLPTPAIYNYNSVTTQGWGLNDDDVIGQSLTQIDVTVRPKEECNQEYQSINRKTQQYFNIKFRLPELFNNPSLFCADHTINQNTGTCRGDSGGPSFRRLELENVLQHYLLFRLFTEFSLVAPRGTPSQAWWVAVGTDNGTVEEACQTSTHS